MKTDYTHITVVLDRSGSMQAVAADTIGGFNKFLSDQKAVPGHATFTLVQFDSQSVDTLNDGTPILAVANLTDKTFQPRGGTPLYDAIGQTINATGKFLKNIPEDARPAKVVFVIITDGFENASHEFTREKVFEMIKLQRDAYKWEFVFIGANQDAMATGQGLGVAGANCMTSAHNAVGTSALYDSASSNLRSYRMSAKSNMSFEKTDYDKQAAAGAKTK